MRTPTAPSRANSSLSNPMRGYRPMVTVSRSLTRSFPRFAGLPSERLMLVFTIAFVNLRDRFPNTHALEPGNFGYEIVSQRRVILGNGLNRWLIPRYRAGTTIIK